MENYHLTGTEFQFYKMKSILEMDGGEVAQCSECISPKNCTLKHG